LKQSLIIFLTLISFYQLKAQENYQETGNILPTEFVYDNYELDSFVVDNFVRPDDCLQYGINFDIWLEFVVDSLSRVSEVKLMDIKSTGNKWSPEFKLKIDSLKPILKKEAVRVINASSGLWIPAEENGIGISQLIDYRMEIRTPEYYSKYEHYRYIGKMATVDYIPFDFPHDNAVKYYNLGVKKMNQKKYFIAIRYFEQSLQLGNQTKDVYYNLGVAQYLYGFKDDACMAWSRASQLGDEEAAKMINSKCKSK